MKKYELTAEFIEQWGKKLFRIKALISLEVLKLVNLVDMWKKKIT